MPPKGWLNDPNGLCFFQGKYHVFFQYAPEYPKMGMKCWGHYIGESLIDWNYAGIAIYPDQPYDKDGVYSGSALVEHEKMHLFYTANYKEEGNYDYIMAGRRADTVLLFSEDGIQFSPKQVVISTEEYPKSYTNHVRDPKVWKENQRYYMALGGRLKEDKGTVLLYESTNLKDWKWLNELTTKDAFGYMWECPDIFWLGNKRVLSFSPQGLKQQEFRFQNKDQSGYVFIEKGNIFDSKDKICFGEFQEWDMGFDFYAPQTFQEETGRRILIGWAGVGYHDYTHPSLEEEGWIHALTVPRELTVKENKIYQYPVEEINQLRKEQIICQVQNEVVTKQEILDMEIQTQQDKIEEFYGIIKKGLELRYKDNVFSMKFTKEGGYGRTQRKGWIEKLYSIRILIDTSLIEVYLNQGEMVFTTRIYSREKEIRIQCENAKIDGWSMRAMNVQEGKKDE